MRAHRYPGGSRRRLPAGGLGVGKVLDHEQRLNRCAVIELRHEGNDVATLVATEAMPALARGIDDEARVAVVVEGAPCPIPTVARFDRRLAGEGFDQPHRISPLRRGESWS